MPRKWIVLLLTTLFFIAGCHSPLYNQTIGNVADTVVDSDKRRAESDALMHTAPAVLVKDGSYVDTTPININRSPTWLKNQIVIRGDQLPFTYYSRTIARGAGDNVLTTFQTGLDPSTNVSISYKGTVKGALDTIAAKTGYVYTIDKNTIYWQAFLTKTYDIAFMPGSSDYLMGKKSGGSSGSSSGGGSGGAQVSSFVNSDSSDAEYSNLSGKLSIWDDLSTAVRQLLSDKGQVTISQATTSVTVRDRPSNIELISQYIENLNKNLSKQVLVKVQVMEVNLNNDFTFGINWQAVARAFHASPFSINANYGTPVSITTLSPQSTAAGADSSATTLPTFGIQGDNKTTPNYTILFNALNQQGKTSIVSEPRVVCLNNQVSVIRITQQKGYLASIQNTSLPGTSTTATAAAPSTVTSQITPGIIITGITLYILPKILDNDVYLQINADLSTLLALDSQASGGTNSTTIQLPRISSKNFNQRSKIHSGDTLILSGFRQLTNTANAMQLLESQALGGKGATQGNTETIVLITPIILNGTV